MPKYSTIFFAEGLDSLIYGLIIICVFFHRTTQSTAAVTRTNQGQGQGGYLIIFG